MSFLSSRALSLLLAAAFSASLATKSLAANEMSTTELITLLRDAKIVSPSTRIDVVIAEREVTILTKRSAKATDNDLKINAVLMGKTLMDPHSKEVSRVKVLYSIEGADAVDEVVVRAGDVKSFDAGSLTEDQLLSSLEIRRVSGDSMSGGSSDARKAAVAAGPFKERRVMLLSRIEDLKQGGTGVQPFMQLFQKIEEQAKSGNTKEIGQAMNDLAARLAEQEKLKKQAQQIGKGHSPKPARTTATSSSAPLVFSVPVSTSGQRGANQAGGVPLVVRLLAQAKFMDDAMSRETSTGVQFGGLRNRLRAILNELEQGRAPANAESDLARIEEDAHKIKNAHSGSTGGNMPPWQQRQQQQQQQSNRWGENSQNSPMAEHWKKMMGR